MFLADRNSLVTQAKRNFVNLLPDLSCSNLVEEKDNYTLSHTSNYLPIIINEKIDNNKVINVKINALENNKLIGSVVDDN